MLGIRNVSATKVSRFPLHFIISLFILSSQSPVMLADQRLNQTVESWLYWSWSVKQVRIQSWKCTDVEVSQIHCFTDPPEFAGESDLSYTFCSACSSLLTAEHAKIWELSCHSIHAALISIKLYKDFPKLFNAFSRDQSLYITLSIGLILMISKKISFW